jgi:phosphate transport system permease protein
MIKEKIFIFSIKLIVFIIALIIAGIFGYLLYRGFHVLSFEFIFSMPRDFMKEGGIFPAILGTFLLVSISISVALPFGLATAIYLNEYKSKGFLADLIRVSINTLSGVPSVVFGLFGYGIFVNLFGLGVSLISGALTLSILSLPIIISSTLQALSSVPYSYREASMALGATKWETIKRVVIPAAMPSILTAIILSIARVSGETAPLLFTACVFYQPKLPDSLLSPVMALPYHIYALISEGTEPEIHIPMAYGTAIVLFTLVIILSSFAIIYREKRRKYDKVRV